MIDPASQFFTKNPKSQHKAYRDIALRVWLDGRVFPTLSMRFALHLVANHTLAIISCMMVSCSFCRHITLWFFKDPHARWLNMLYVLSKVWK